MSTLVNNLLKEKMSFANFSIDCSEEFYGIHFNEDWNGFAIPYFDLENARNVVSRFNVSLFDAMKEAYQDHYYFDAEKQAFIHVYFEEFNEDGCCDCHRDEVENVVIDGIKYWSIGGGSWTWEIEQEKKFR